MFIPPLKPDKYQEPKEEFTCQGNIILKKKKKQQG
jgi:hypothetical protein